MQNPDVQTSGSLDNTKFNGGNMKKCKKVTKVKTKTCEYNKAEMTWASTDSVSVCVGPEGNPQQKMKTRI